MSCCLQGVINLACHRPSTIFQIIGVSGHGGGLNAFFPSLMLPGLTSLGSSGHLFFTGQPTAGLLPGVCLKLMNWSRGRNSSEIEGSKRDPPPGALALVTLVSDLNRFQPHNPHIGRLLRATCTGLMGLAEADGAVGQAGGCGPALALPLTSHKGTLDLVAVVLGSRH